MPTFFYSWEWGSLGFRKTTLEHINILKVS
jgi:hypothetical protein